MLGCIRWAAHTPHTQPPSHLVRALSLANWTSVQTQGMSYELLHFREIPSHEWAAAWRLTLCGLRRSEVLGMTWDCVDLERGEVKVEHGRVLLDHG